MKFFAGALVCSFIFSVGVSSAQLSDPPKREMRGAWIATVGNIDWPSKPGLPVAQQKAELVSIFDSLEAIGINAVFFQVRPACDAFYKSSIEPWSYRLTGKQGEAPSPFYDPLKFAIRLAHERGMELHAWLNPFRAVVKVGSFPLDSMQVSVTHPGWILTFGTLKILNPGIPAVRNYITSVIMDIVRRYDVDGIHFDDYFYPYSGITNQDDSTFEKYNRGYTNIADWRRGNINLFVREVHDSVEAVRPWVKFGISPFGIWKSGIPAGTHGFNAYDILYADAITWLQHGLIDYVAPQLYWPNGGGTDYARLMQWWADSTTATDRDLYVGQGAYRIPRWASGEIERHIRQDRANGKVAGSIYFSARSLTDNLGNFADSLEQNYYRHPALVPSMAWKGSMPPAAPRHLRYAETDSGIPEFSWNPPAVVMNGNTATRYVIYRVDRSGISPADLDNARNIVSVYGSTSSVPPVPSGRGPYSYSVTALDRNWNESRMGNIVTVYHPSPPLLAYPSNKFLYGRDTTVLGWRASPLASSYRLQVATDSTFTKGLLINLAGVAHPSFAATGMSGETEYYWRVAASNAGGTSPLSDVRSFTTAFPVAPLLAGPDSLRTNVSLLPRLLWHPTANTTEYRLQVAREGDFSAPVLDATVSSGSIELPDTSFTPASSLAGNTIYRWRVGSGNRYGFSHWSNSWKFTTMAPVWVALSYETPTALSPGQNYAAQFRSTIAVSYQLSAAAHVTVRMYDVLGREVAELFDARENPGTHRVTFDASKLADGVYFYRIVAGGYSTGGSIIYMK